VWGLSVQSEDRVNVGVVARAADGDHSGHLFVINLTTLVGIEGIEERSKLDGGEGASERFKALAELSEFDSAVTVEIEVLENALAGLTLVISAMGALADLLEDDATDLSEASGVHTALVSGESPSVNNDLSEVGLAFSGKHDVHQRVVNNESLLVALSFASSDGVEGSAESSEHILSLFLTGKNARVLVSNVTGLELINSNEFSALGEFSPGTFDNSEAGVAHISAHSLDQFVVGDGAVLVVVEVVLEGAELLGGQEDTKAGEHSLKLELVEHLVEVFVIF
jgi:hypothetical protein